MSFIERIVNVETDEVIERELSKIEIKELTDSKIASEAREAEIIAKLAARKEILVKLGLTEDEAKILLS